MEYKSASQWNTSLAGVCTLLYFSQRVWEFFLVGHSFEPTLGVCNLWDVSLMCWYNRQVVGKCSSVSTTFCLQWVHRLPSLLSVSFPKVEAAFPMCY